MIPIPLNYTRTNQTLYDYEIRQERSIHTGGGIRGGVINMTGDTLSVDPKAILIQLVFNDLPAGSYAVVSDDSEKKPVAFESGGTITFPYNIYHRDTSSGVVAVAPAYTIITGGEDIEDENVKTSMVITKAGQALLMAYKTVKNVKRTYYDIEKNIMQVHQTYTIL